MMKAEDIEERLGGRLHADDVREIVAWAMECDANRCRLWEWAHSADERTGMNALWCMSYLPRTEAARLQLLQQELIDMVLEESNVSKKRILLQLLREQSYDAEDVRADFLDFCLSKINSACEPYAIRAFAVYCAFNMCRHYPELLAELECELDMLATQQLNPGLKAALRITRAKIDRIPGRAGSA